MGSTNDFEASLQVFCGFDIDITHEVNEIKVNIGEFHFVLCFCRGLRHHQRDEVQFVFQTSNKVYICFF